MKHINMQLSRANVKLEITLTEGLASGNWFWYLKDQSGKIIKRCRPGGCDTYHMASQEAISEYVSRKDKPNGL